MENSPVQPVRVSSPSRIHCGLFSVGAPDAAGKSTFGGMGIMVEAPRTVVSIEPAAQLAIETASTVGHDASAELCHTVHNVVRLWLARYGSHCEEFSQRGLNAARLLQVEDLPVRIMLEQVPPRHCGFGSGTQLALSVSAALFHGLNQPLAAPEEIAPVVGRGNRSAIGTHGFFSGGLLIDRGKQPDSGLAPLDFRIDFPEHWPILLVVNRNARGAHGADEKAAFRRLPPTPEADRRDSIRLVRDEVVPALTSLDYERFASAVFEFGYRSGMLFQSVQGGPYNGPEIENTIRLIRETGIHATGQSSWGPAVFAVTPDMESAGRLASQLRENVSASTEVIVTRADNSGVRINAKPEFPA